jgi:hypothetical protein
MSQTMSGSAVAIDTAASEERCNHVIDIEKLIVHKYDAREALLKKADKIAREIIHSELRPGEFLRALKPGHYQLVLPKMRHDAGALRTAVITAKLYRAIRTLNPTVKTVIDHPRGPATPTPKPVAAPRRGGTSFLSKSRPDQPEDDNQEEMRRAASQALERMSSGLQTKAEELFTQPGARLLLNDIQVKFQPVWNAKKSLISSYAPVVVHRQGETDASILTTVYNLSSIEVTHAILDAACYKSACAALTELMQRGEQAAILLPVHFSTVDHSRFIGAYLDAGAAHQDLSREFISFELCDLPNGLSRYRLREAVAYLRGRSRAISASLGPNWASQSLALFKEMGIFAVGIAPAGMAPGEQRIMATLEAFASKCDAAGVMAYCLETHTLSLLSCAIGAGFGFVGGRAVGPALDGPLGFASFDLQKLLTLASRNWAGPPVAAPAASPA